MRFALDLVGGPEKLSANAACKRVGEQLGIVPDSLRNWVQQARIDVGRAPGLTTDERARLVELERVLDRYHGLVANAKLTPEVDKEDALVPLVQNRTMKSMRRAAELVRLRTDNRHLLYPRPGPGVSPLEEALAPDSSRMN